MWLIIFVAVFVIAAVIARAIDEDSGILAIGLPCIALAITFYLRLWVFG